MKRPFLVLLAVLASVGFGVWLVRTPHSLREILTACGAWVLGFWVAAALQARGRRLDPDDEESWDDEGVEDDDEEDAWEDEDWEEEDER